MAGNNQVQRDLEDILQDVEQRVAAMMDDVENIGSDAAGWGEPAARIGPAAEAAADELLRLLETIRTARG